MSNVVLHIGLHKTATRFLQRAVFANLDPHHYWFNPPVLMRALQRAIRRPTSDSRQEFLETASRVREYQEGRILVISDPDISGNMFNNHADYLDNLELVREAFPSATILYFVRRQSDWLHSAYRQALVKGRSRPIELFLNFRDGEFQRRPARRVDGMRTLDALALRFLEIYRSYANAYGADNIYLFRQEDLRRRPNVVYEMLARSLGLEGLPPVARKVSGNRAFSALAIAIFYPGTWRTPSPDRVVLSNQASLGEGNKMIKVLRKLRTLFIRHGFDRIAYVDWDLLARNNMREALDAHYSDEERRLQEIADAILAHGPGEQAFNEATTLRAAAPADEGNNKNP